MSLELVSKPKLHIFIGVPGCGKSTFAEQFDCRVVSTDSIRADLTGDMTDQSKNDLVFTVFHNTIGWLLGEGDSAVADSTALDGFARGRLREIAALHQAETHAYFFRNTLEAVARNRARDRCVPDHVMTRMIEKYERTTLVLPQEHYDSVVEIRSFR